MECNLCIRVKLRPDLRCSEVLQHVVLLPWRLRGCRALYFWLPEVAAVWEGQLLPLVVMARLSRHEVTQPPRDVAGIDCQR